MKKKRFATLLLVALLLFTPTVILIVRAATVGRFPKPNEVLGVEITDATGEKTTLLPGDLLFEAFFEIVSESERVFLSSLPKGCDSFRVDLLLEGKTERLNLYFDRSDCSVYIRNSENRLFLFRDPELELLDTVLSPAKIELCERGEEIPFLSYPTGNQSFTEIGLIRWEKLSEIVFSEDACRAVFNLYEKGTDGGYEFVREVTDFSELSEESTDAAVLCIVRWELFDEIDLIHYYFFTLGAK